MQNWKTIAHEAKDLLTVCLAKAIDQALTAQSGAGWFADFAQADAQLKLNLRITKPGQVTVQDMDLQALLKFLRFRDGFTRQVLTYHGFFSGLDAIATDAQMGQLNQLLDRLMVDFRNRIEAHSRAADIEQEISGNGLNRIYGYEEAVQDMLRLARLFPAVCDNRGVSYCRRIEALTKPKKKKRWLPIVATLSAVTVALAGGVAWWTNQNGATQSDTSEQPNVFYDDSDPVYTQGEINVQPIHVYYDGDAVIMESYITNGTDDTIKELNVPRLILSRDGSALAAANFGVLNLESKKVTIPPQSHITWRFTFYNDTVLKHNASLNNLSVEASCENYEMWK